MNLPARQIPTHQPRKFLHTFTKRINLINLRLLMENLYLLFTKDALQYQLKKNKTVSEEKGWVLEVDDNPNVLTEKLDSLLARSFQKIEVISAFNHFAMTPDGFTDHDYGLDMINLNAKTDAEKEELMLSVNKKYGVQFYYTFPLEIYQKIKEKSAASSFNFSGEKFLNSLASRGGKEIHINLYHNQCEFIALDRKKVLLYNNLDVNSEVDFLYFIMFTLSKIGFGINDTNFYVYGETTANETFISELRKFVKKLKIVYDNVPKKNFILS